MHFIKGGDWVDSAYFVFGGDHSYFIVQRFNFDRVRAWKLNCHRSLLDIGFEATHINF